VYAVNVLVVALLHQILSLRTKMMVQSGDELWSKVTGLAATANSDRLQSAMCVCSVAC